jgi:Fe-S-cluster containining protein
MKPTIAIDKQQLNAGLQLMQQPVLPLISMVQFFFFTGEFTTVTEVIDEMPSPIETAYTTYRQPQELLRRHRKTLQLLESIKTQSEPKFEVITLEGELLDAMTAASAVTLQQILTDELEEINSRLCTPCSCRLCCVGPDLSMEQNFFEIPLKDTETALFAVNQIDTDESRAHLSMDAQPLEINNSPFYQQKNPGIFHWKNGWSLILPKSANCPHLEQTDGRCRVYPDRPEVCRRPQIFPYIIEKMDSKGTKPRYRLRQSLLAIVDCPYVSILREEIAAYGAACELDVIFKQNKA